MTASLTSSLRMDQAYAPNHVYAPRAHPQSCHWVTRDQVVLDAITCNQFPIAGDMPIICSAGGTTPLGLELLAEAGLQPAGATHPYQSPEHAVEIARCFGNRGTRVVVQHVYPDEVLRDGALWIEPRVLSYLNNKGNLGELAPAANLATRTVMSADAFFGNGNPRQLPIVLKIPTDLSTGGGTYVAICRTLDDLMAARERFAGSERLVVEAYQSVRRNVCLHYVVMPDGTVQCLGFADQDIDSHGHYRGNWIFLGSTLLAEAVDVGLRIVTRGAALGYRGFVGIDVVETEAGRCIVLDLNFRLNGSTAAVLLAPAIQRALGQCCLHLRGFACEAGFSRLIEVARSAVRSGKLIPIGTFDAAAAGYSGQPARLSALVIAESQTDAQKIEAELAASGLA